ncbi:MAG: BrnT family toxin [Chloroflexi bacterium]|nr:BrnT family toxin [Chloroflexota bacterium]
MRIYRLIVEPEREEHIARHHVSVEEVEDVASGNVFVRRARQGYRRLIGQTSAGRYLTIFVAPRGGGVYGLVTARDATPAERRRYQEHRGQ